jgi:hypothetical protein
MTTIATTAALDVLLEGLVDYAGLFPPAALGMADAVAEYAWARGSADRAALARFVVPAGRLDEFGAAVAAHPEARGWRLSALLGPDVAVDLARIAAWNADARDLLVDSVEFRAGSPEEAAALLTQMPSQIARFVEFAAIAEPEPYLEAILAAGASAKIRMGGVTAEAFPAPAHVIRFLAACARHGVSFKATAGLHHPVRGMYRLTYAADAPLGLMYGYLNLFLAAALLRTGGTEADAEAILTETAPGAFVLTADAITWRTHRFDRAALTDLRTHGALGIGSCSFREPLDDLRALGLR